MGNLADWPWWKVISITGQAGSGTDYQVELEIGDSAGGDFHLEGHCTNFPQDIRITDNDGTTLLDHWVEDLTADPIKVWVEVKDDLGSNQTIRVYYGKSGETTVSSIQNTWICGDDFNDNDISDWNTGDFEGHIGTKLGVSNGEVGASGTTEAWMKKSVGSTITDYTLIWRTKTGGSQWTSIQIGVDSSDTFYSHVLQDNNDDFKIGTDERGAFGSANPLQYLNWGVSNAAYYTFKIKHIIDGNFKMYKDGVDITLSLDTNSADSVLQSITDIAIGCRYGSDVVDFVALGKYVSPEPAFSSAGAEQSAAGAPTSVFYGPLIGPFGGPI